MDWGERVVEPGWVGCGKRQSMVEASIRQFQRCGKLLPEPNPGGTRPATPYLTAGSILGWPKLCCKLVGVTESDEFSVAVHCRPYCMRGHRHAYPSLSATPCTIEVIGVIRILCKKVGACCVTRLGCPSTKAENFPKREGLRDLTSGLFVIPFYFLLPFSSHNPIIIIIILRFIDWNISHGTPFYALKFLLFDPVSFRLGNFSSTRLS